MFFAPYPLLSDTTKEIISLTRNRHGQSCSTVRKEIAFSFLSRLVQRVRLYGQKACVPYGTYHRDRQLYLKLQETIRRLFRLPTRLTVAQICHHEDLRAYAEQMSHQTGTLVKTPSYDQVWDYIHMRSQKVRITRKFGHKCKWKIKIAAVANLTFRFNLDEIRFQFRTHTQVCNELHAKWQ
jgi:hypothetical protein